ncbi:MAG: hypothetical protein AAF539_07105 [Planctomycetota bacterium]
MLAVFTAIAILSPALRLNADSYSHHAPASQQNADLTVDAKWTILTTEEMVQWIRIGLDQVGTAPEGIDQATDVFLAAIEEYDAEALQAWVNAVASQLQPIADLMRVADRSLVSASASLDPNESNYAMIESLPPRIRAGVRTWLGRELVRRRLFDEALPIFAEVDPATSPDAAALLFYRGSCYHALLNQKAALRDLRQLLLRDDELPARFSRTASMMVADLKPLKEDSLDEISRLMTDVTRRLELGKANDSTTSKEQTIIDKLTKMIDDLEQQQQQQQQQQSQSGEGSGKSGSGSTKPMEDSRIAGASGQGDVERKNIDDEAGWGNLPPAERRESLQQISRDLPSHYREAIEAYFRKLATQTR